MSRAVPFAATSPVPPKLPGNPPHFIFCVGQHGAIVLRFLDFVRRPWLCETLLKLVEGVGADRAPLPAQHHESYRPVQLGDFCGRESLRDFFRQPKSGHAETLTIALLHVVVDLDVPIPDRYLIGQPLESLAHIWRNESISVDAQPGCSKCFH
jgi:hypothetical protein